MAASDFCLTAFMRITVTVFVRRRCSIGNRASRVARGTLGSMAIDRNEPAERRARIDQLIEEYRAAKQRRLVRLAIELWRDTEARQQFVELEAPPQRIH